MVCDCDQGYIWSWIEVVVQLLKASWYSNFPFRFRWVNLKIGFFQHVFLHIIFFLFYVWKLNGEVLFYRYGARLFKMITGRFEIFQVIPDTKSFLQISGKFWCNRSSRFQSSCMLWDWQMIIMAKTYTVHDKDVECGQLWMLFSFSVSDGCKYAHCTIWCWRTSGYNYKLHTCIYIYSILFIYVGKDLAVICKYRKANMLASSQNPTQSVTSPTVTQPGSNSSTPRTASPGALRVGLSQLRYRQMRTQSTPTSAKSTPVSRLRTQRTAASNRGVVGTHMFAFQPQPAHNPGKYVYMSYMSYHSNTPSGIRAYIIFIHLSPFHADSF